MLRIFCDRGGDGAEVIYALRNNGKLANLVLDSIEASGQNVRKAYQRRLPSDTSKDYYFIHRNTGKTEPIIVEYGFLDSTSDDVSRLKNNWRQLTEAVVKGVSEYIGVPSNQPIGDYYTVKSGDSLYSIARNFNTTVDELKRLNNLTSNNLSIGQRLLIPKDEETGDTNTYVVKSGDTLYGISTKFNISVDELKRLNNLTSNNLSIGQVLKLSNEQPSVSTPSSDMYTVKSGDSLWSIAKNFNTTVDELKRLNNLTTNLLSIGQQLKVSQAANDNVPNNYILYTVKSGDSLYSIARKYNTSVSELMNLNNLTTNLLSLGQQLRIPIDNGSTSTYTVKSGDSLYSIARNFNTTVDELKRLNNLTSNNLSIGQTLKI